MSKGRAASLPPFVSRLEQFYQTPLGQWVQLRLGQRVVSCWPVRRRDRILAVGYAVPYVSFLKAASGGSAPLLFLKVQEAAHSPSQLRNRIVVGCEESLPFADGQFDKILLVHALEASAEPQKLIRELWRVLKAEGELLIVAPRPSGPWVRTPETPWTPGGFSFAQILEILKKHFFVFCGQDRALFAPPLWVQNAPLAASFLEKLGESGLWPFAGVWLIRGQKQVCQLALPPESLPKPALILVEENP